VIPAVANQTAQSSFGNFLVVGIESVAISPSLTMMMVAAALTSNFASRDFQKPEQLYAR